MQAQHEADVRLHVQVARQAGTDGSIGKGRAGGRALQRYAALRCSRRERGGDERDGERGLRDALLLLATGDARRRTAVKRSLSVDTAVAARVVVHDGCRRVGGGER